MAKTKTKSAVKYNTLLIMELNAKYDMVVDGLYFESSQ